MTTTASASRSRARAREARLLARAIISTARRVEGGFITARTAKSHVRSLFGTARHKRVLGRVRRLLGDTRVSEFKEAHGSQTNL